MSQAVNWLRKGEILAYPTETFYGLGADASNEEAIERIFEIKNRDRGKPISILIGSAKELRNWVVGITKRESKLIKKFWPGPLTLVFKAKKSVSSLLTAGTGKIAVRISPEPIAKALALKLKTGITATSANASGKEATRNPAELQRQLGKDFPIVGNKKLKGSKGSTIVDVSSKEISLIREGDIKFQAILKFLKEK